MENKPNENVTAIENCFKTIWVVEENKVGILQKYETKPKWSSDHFKTTGEGL